MWFSRFSTQISIRIIRIPKPWKMPPKNYIEPLPWQLKFAQPSQVRPCAFVDTAPGVMLGPNNEVDKEKLYKNPEYFSYHPLSYYNMEQDLNCKRCRPQPSPFKISTRLSNEKCP
jgi:NADH dehydrogenase [ubiquinone] flavoprotein 3, mitochondrial